MARVILVPIFPCAFCAFLRLGHFERSGVYDPQIAHIAQMQVMDVRGGRRAAAFRVSMHMECRNTLKHSMICLLDWPRKIFALRHNFVAVHWRKVYNPPANPGMVYNEH